MSGFQDELDIYCNDEKNLTKAVALLTNWGCCCYCVLRFLSEKQQYVYRKDTKDLEEWISFCKETTKCSEKDTDESGSKSVLSQYNGASSDVCTACLGILQSTYSSTQFINKLKEASVEHDHEFDDYFASLTVPVPLLLREYGLWLVLKDVFPDIFVQSRKDDITPLKDVWKWINGQPLGSLIGKPFDPRSPYEIAVTFEHKDADTECNFLYEVDGETFRKRKNNKKSEQSIFTRINVNKALASISQDKFRKYYQCPPRSPSESVQCTKITCNHEAVFVAGRYNKYSRSLSQTPWVIDGKRKSESSIEEHICEHLKDTFKADDFRFSSSGREDVDVLMLGTGRPFVVEIINPHRLKFTDAEMNDMQKVINGRTQDIAVRDLQIVTREDTVRLKEGEQDKVKRYSARCWGEKPLNQEALNKLTSLKDLVIKQKTPIRVLHRRPLAVRERTIHEMVATSEDATHFSLMLSTQAGTYIKEFVHGDFGRTKPNLKDLLGIGCDILQLDVDGVELDWPRKIDDY